MARTGELRSDTAQMALPGLPPGARTGRGGGSARQPRPRRQGGGYPDFCSAAENSPLGDPRLAELRRLDRLSPVWLKVAEEIGLEAFVRMWRLLIDEHEPPPAGAPREQVRVYVPSFEWWGIAERNARIRQLSERGHTPGQIVGIVASDGWEISERHVTRVLEK